LMLARAAERVYWMGRYLERAENTARIVQQYSQLLLDLPEEVGVGWPELMRIFGAELQLQAQGGEMSDQAVFRFLLGDGDSRSSLVFALRMARENLRNTRDLLPQESWECLNELYRSARNELASAGTDEDRFDILADCIGRCQQVAGILGGTMSRRSPFHFLILGRCLERADMTSRIIDVATAYLGKNERLVLRYGSTLWTNALKSVSGFQMYRQYCQPQVQGVAVIGFLLQDRDFPRAVARCVDKARASAAELPRGNATIDALDDIGRFLAPIATSSLVPGEVSALMDDVQQRLGAIHGAVAGTWFLAGDS
ncbi:MAG: alpha-E domain-containing protein, partial [Pseudomonadota bacterium]